MSCFKLPKSVTSDLESLLMNFWWERNSNKRGIPWIAWNKLKLSKKEGGLGFRDLEKFNDALLAKQAWRLIQHPNSLFAKVMKAHYYKDDPVLDAKPRKNQSYGWSFLLLGLDLIKRGTRYIVGDEKSIRVGIDNVLPSHPPRPVTHQSPDPNLSIDHFIDAGGSYRSWDTSKIASLITAED
ncbi:PREDICTED: uncharacterized protein LOC109131652, partial [Camelina sativa]|uniref:Uncharacterized protein LOC109131652 n=1 Tax=Camelina sativa TaxID=90675 RepID=A0ABM1RH76_CAMSA